MTAKKPYVYVERPPDPFRELCALAASNDADALCDYLGSDQPLTAKNRHDLAWVVQTLRARTGRRPGPGTETAYIERQIERLYRRLRKDYLKRNGGSQLPHGKKDELPQQATERIEPLVLAGKYPIGTAEGEDGGTVDPDTMRKIDIDNVRMRLGNKLR